MDTTRHTGGVALLTGAGSGIGLATAKRLAEEGAIVVGRDVKAAAVDTARAEVPSGTFALCDVTDRAAVDALVARTLADHGNAICPGGVRTNIVFRDDLRSDWGLDRLRKFHALADRTAEPDEIAALVSWLASTEASNLNGAIVTADGGWTAG